MPSFINFKFNLNQNQSPIQIAFGLSFANPSIRFRTHLTFPSVGWYLSVVSSSPRTEIAPSRRGMDFSQRIPYTTRMLFSPNNLLRIGQQLQVMFNSHGYPPSSQTSQPFSSSRRISQDILFTPFPSHLTISQEPFTTRLTTSSISYRLSRQPPSLMNAHFLPIRVMVDLQSRLLLVMMIVPTLISFITSSLLACLSRERIAESIWEISQRMV